MKKIIEFVRTKKGKAILIAALLFAGALADLTVNTLDDSVLGKLLELVETIEVEEVE